MKFSPRILILTVCFVSILLIFVQVQLGNAVTALGDNRSALAAAPDPFETGVEASVTSVESQQAPVQVEAAPPVPGAAALAGDVTVQENLAEQVQADPALEQAASPPPEPTPASLPAAEVAAIPGNPADAPIPDTASQSAVQAATSGLDPFAQSLVNGQANELRGVYVEGVMALRIVQQPVGDVAFVSMEGGTATLFQSPAYFDVVGLLAHNFLSGLLFYNINPGHEIYLVYGDGRTQGYRVTQIAHFQRLNLGDLQSDFIDLQTGARLSSTELFQQYYQGAHHLTLQTCLEQNGISDWGLRFVVAEPL